MTLPVTNISLEMISDVVKIIYLTVCAHLGEELESQDPGLGEVAHDADGDGEES